jgi:hypothetical protein
MSVGDIHIRRFRVLSIALLGVAALMSQPVMPAWLAGHWLQCGPHVEVSETWTDARGDVLLGMSKTIGRHTSWELSRIERSGQGVSFFANPSGQKPTEFKATQIGDNRIMFENSAHDFPQRILYRREGDRLIASIEGVVGGKARSSEWNYTLSPFNATCPG